jgi:(p)ppGpp synthase/HD superfamily hydrolase
MSLLNRAIQIAVDAHSGQVDKAGQPYVLHPLRVMLKMSNEDERIVAVLHDVVEDTPWTLEALAQEGYPDRVLQAIDNVTKRDGESYEAFVARAASDPLSRKVKIADIEDNCDLTRISSPTQKDFARIEKYKAALRQLSLLK